MECEEMYKVGWPLTVVSGVATTPINGRKYMGLSTKPISIYVRVAHLVESG